MKKISLTILIGVLIFSNLGLVFEAKAATTSKTAKKSVKTLTANDLLNQFLIQTESYNRLWYASRKTKVRYYISNDADLQWLIDKFSLKVSEKDLAKIAANKKNKKTTAALLTKYKGQLIFGASNPKNIWYLNPADGIRYPVKDFKSFSDAIKIIGLKVKDQALRQVAMNKEQLTFDAAFPSVAYVKYDGTDFSDGFYNNTILPLASLSKVMTALVLMDQDLAWDKYVTVTQAEIDYPKIVVGDDATSEVSLQAGDQVKINDLWIAMLAASSNQAAVILADNCGLSRQEFVEQMNEKAKSFGLVKTKFHEMTGLNPDNISTAQEMAIMASFAFAKPKIALATNVTDYTFTVMGVDGNLREVNVKNRNYSLLAFKPDASKTGFLVEAQRNSVIKKDDKIIVVLHAASSVQRNQIITRLLNTDSKLSLNR
ncbi:MAG: serine hydrolase [Patescibacteria group bacterium]